MSTLRITSANATIPMQIVSIDAPYEDTDYSRTTLRALLDEGSIVVEEAQCLVQGVLDGLWWSGYKPFYIAARYNADGQRESYIRISKPHYNKYAPKADPPAPRDPGELRRIPFGHNTELVEDRETLNLPGFMFFTVEDIEPSAQE